MDPKGLSNTKIQYLIYFPCINNYNNNLVIVIIYLVF